MRIENLRSPLICTSATPGTVCTRGLTSRLIRSVISSGDSVSLLNASQMVGVASASTLAMTGSSMAAGKRPRTRDTRSRTSAAPSSGLLLSLKRTVIWLCSERDVEVMMSTPSMPAIESSSGLVTCDSITSDDAPVRRVVTLTTGSSMRGYSRTCRRNTETAPMSTSSSDITVAKTGRRIEISENFIASLLDCFSDRPTPPRRLVHADGPTAATPRATGVPRRRQCPRP